MKYYCTVLLLLLISCSALAQSSLNRWGTLPTTSIITNDYSCTIVFPQQNTIDRVYVAGTNTGLHVWDNSNGVTNPIAQANVWVGTSSSTNADTLVGSIDWVPAQAGQNPSDYPIDIRFSPIAGDHVIILFSTNVNWQLNSPPWGATQYPTNFHYNFVHVETYGCIGTFANSNAVVWPGGNSTLGYAASDLSYYYTELTGQPYPIVTTASTNGLNGKLLYLVDRKPLAANYSMMISNVATGVLPTNEICNISNNITYYDGWPYRAVYGAVYKDLQNQGVCFAFPDEHGDTVPFLSQLGQNGTVGFTNTPSTTIIQLSFSDYYLCPWANDAPQNMPPQQWFAFNYATRDEQYMLPYFNFPEVPQNTNTSASIPPDFQYGMQGTAENFNVIWDPSFMYSNKPPSLSSPNGGSWGFDDVANQCKTSNPTANYSIFPNFTNQFTVSWAARKLSWIASNFPPYQLDNYANGTAWGYDIPQTAYGSFSFYPNDFPQNSIDGPISTQPQQPFFQGGDDWTFLGNRLNGQGYGFAQTGFGTNTWNSASANYWGMITNIGIQVQSQHIIVNGQAYIDTLFPPVTFTTPMPTNIVVDVTRFGCANLPVSAPQCYSPSNCFSAWHSVASLMVTHEYTFIFCDGNHMEQTWFIQPNVASIVSWSQYEYSLGALGCLIENNPQSLNAVAQTHNPWDYYAELQMHHNASQSEATVLTNFFRGMYGEAWQPMMAFYLALENWQVQNNVSLRSYYPGFQQDTANPGYANVNTLRVMDQELQLAEATVTNWDYASRVLVVSNDFQTTLAQYGYNPATYYLNTTFPTITSSPITLIGAGIVAGSMKALNTLVGANAGTTLSNGAFTNAPNGLYPYTWEMQGEDSSVETWFYVNHTGYMTVSGLCSADPSQNYGRYFASVSVDNFRTNMQFTASTNFSVNIPVAPGNVMLMVDTFQNNPSGNMILNSLSTSFTSTNPTVAFNSGTGTGTAIMVAH